MSFVLYFEGHYSPLTVCVLEMLSAELSAQDAVYTLLEYMTHASVELSVGGFVFIAVAPEAVRATEWMPPATPAAPTEPAADDGDDSDGEDVRPSASKSAGAGAGAIGGGAAAGGVLIVVVAVVLLRRKSSDDAQAGRAGKVEDHLDDSFGQVLLALIFLLIVQISYLCNFSVLGL